MELWSNPDFLYGFTVACLLLVGGLLWRFGAPYVMDLYLRSRPRPLGAPWSVHVEQAIALTRDRQAALPRRVPFGIPDPLRLELLAAEQSLRAIPPERVMDVLAEERARGWSR